MSLSIRALPVTVGVALSALSAALIVMVVPAEGFTDEDDQPRREMPLDDPDGEDDQDRGDSSVGTIDQPQTGRQRLEAMSRDQLEEEGFVFEDTLTQRQRAHATIFALTAGAVVSGAGHWHLDDSGTAASLLAMDLVAYSLMGGAMFLSVSPTGREAVDERRYELGYGGMGLLGTSWLIDVFGTAYRDELGIPTSTRRHYGWGIGASYQYWRPPELNMRHLVDAELTGRGRHFELIGRTAQELSLGMSDYELSARWFPFVGTTPETRLGVGLTGRHRSYRIDEPFRRVEAGARIHGSLNLGRLVGHLDQMTLGALTGLSLREGSPRHRSVRLRDGHWEVPAELFLAFNPAEQLRVRVSWERSTDHWLERWDELGPVGVGSLEVTYRSSERLDLGFFSSFGDGVGIGTGLQAWFGE